MTPETFGVIIAAIAGAAGATWAIVNAIHGVRDEVHDLHNTFKSKIEEHKEILDDHEDRISQLEGEL
jgi:hypothetical protein